MNDEQLQEIIRRMNLIEQREYKEVRNLVEHYFKQTVCKEAIKRKIVSQGHKESLVDKVLEELCL